MTCRVIQVRVNAVETISIVPLVYRLRRLDMALVQAHIYG